MEREDNSPPITNTTHRHTRSHTGTRTSTVRTLLVLYTSGQIACILGKNKAACDCPLAPTCFGTDVDTEIDNAAGRQDRASVRKWMPHNTKRNTRRIDTRKTHASGAIYIRSTIQNEEQCIRQHTYLARYMYTHKSLKHNITCSKCRTEYTLQPRLAVQWRL